MRRHITRYVLATLAIWMVGPDAMANHRFEEARYDDQRRELKTVYQQNLEVLRGEYRTAVKSLVAERQVALQLCEPQRSCELERIKRERRLMAEAFRYDMAVARRNHRMAVERLEAWHELACRRARISRKFGVVEPGCPEAQAPSFSALPQAAAIEGAADSPSFPAGISSMEEYFPGVIELPASEGPAFPESIPSG